MEGVYHIKGSHVCPTASLVWLAWRRAGTARESHECNEQADTYVGENLAEVREQTVRERQIQATGLAPASGLQRAR